MKCLLWEKSYHRLTWCVWTMRCAARTFLQPWPTLNTLATTWADLGSACQFLPTIPVSVQGKENTTQEAVNCRSLAIFDHISFLNLSAIFQSKSFLNGHRLEWCTWTDLFPKCLLTLQGVRHQACIKAESLESQVSLTEFVKDILMWHCSWNEKIVTPLDLCWHSAIWMSAESKLLSHHKNDKEISPTQCSTNLCFLPHSRAYNGKVWLCIY